MRKVRLCLWLCGILLVSCQAQVSSPAWDSEEYAIYSALINEMFVKGSVNVIVIWDHTSVEGIDEVPAFQIGWLRADLMQLRGKWDLPPEVLDDFTSKNKEKHLLEERFSLKTQYVLVSRSDLEEILKAGREWEGFYSKFPDSQGLTILSRVGLNDKRNQALVWVENVSYVGDTLTDSGGYVFLTKAAGSWVIQNSSYGILSIA